MFKGINMHELKKYISPNDPNKDNPTVFYFGPTDKIVDAYIEDNSIEFVPSKDNPDTMEDIKILYAKRNLLNLKSKLRKIENFYDPEVDQVVTFEAEENKIPGGVYLIMPDKVINKLDKRLNRELISQLPKLDSLSEEEVKN